MMTVPAYHLRPNKAVDRLVLMEAIRRLARLDGKGLEGYTYHGLGGPYLEDFRLLYELYPKIGMVSIEIKKRIFERQEFHRPCRSLKLERGSLSSFITRYNPGNAKSIFWLDYNKLEYACFKDFQRLLVSVAPDSMIKITLPSDHGDLLTPGKRRSPTRISKFCERFSDFMPNAPGDPPRNSKCFAGLLQDMIQIAAQQALLAVTMGKKFIPLSSFYYTDGTPMFTITGVVCSVDREDKLKEVFADWEFANLVWEPPRQINVPTLSTKERLHLQQALPTRTSAQVLCERLGYSIEDTYKKTKETMEQYAAFHRYVPYFLKGVP